MYHEQPSSKFVHSRRFSRRAVRGGPLDTLELPELVAGAVEPLGLSAGSWENPVEKPWQNNGETSIKHT